MSSKLIKLKPHRVKSLLQKTLLHTIENITKHLYDFLQTKEPECLHQYRINVRMARSICLEFGTFMESKRQYTLDKILKTLQKETNDMRDTDVFLDCLEAYKKRVASTYLREFEAIETKLKAEKEVLYKAFETKYTQAFIAHILVKLQANQNDEKLCFPSSKQKISQYLREIFEARLEKIEKISKKLDKNATNALFHKLRLHYKKLRYTSDALSLEQFSKSFKSIQNAFGNVQDKNSQIERIKRYNTTKSQCLEHIIALLEEELIQDKSVCIKKSSQKTVQKMRKDVQKIFTCKGK